MTQAQTTGAPRTPRRRYDKVLYPLLVAVLLLSAWQGAVTGFKLPPYLVPSPLLMMQTLVTDWQVLGGALLFTLKITLLSFGVAVLLGVGVELTEGRAGAHATPTSAALTEPAPDT